MYLDTLRRSQFGKPSGPLGSWFMGPLLNFVNVRLVNATISLLDPDPRDVVLDVGFGGGYSLAALARRTPQGEVVGVDYSREMVDRADGLIRQGGVQSRVRVQCSDVADLPYPRFTFDKVLSVNSIYYWPDLQGSLCEIARVMKGHGRLAVGFRSRSKLGLFTQGWEDFRLYEPREFAGIMEEAGFEVLSVEHRDRWWIPDMVVVVGERKSEELPLKGPRAHRAMPLRRDHH